MISYASPALKATGQGFVGHMQEYNKKREGFANPKPHARNIPMENFMGARKKEGFTCGAKRTKDGFRNYSGAPAGAKDSYEPMGSFDNVRLETGNSSDWRYTKPNEPLNGNFPKFQPGPDNLFMFKDNQCKPECCGASYACDGGCVCTTPEQRDFINMRGGNRTAPDAGV